MREKTPSNRVEYGTQKLKSVLEENGYSVTLSDRYRSDPNRTTVVVGLQTDKVVHTAASRNRIPLKNSSAQEGFSIGSAQRVIVVSGNDATGTLYGCIELVDSLKTNGVLPASITLTDAPEMILRGGVIGMQKTTYLPGRKVYEYPYTPESFPWFYDKELWIEYLDMLVENRYNSFYLWNGHPFASLVKLEDYPFAVEVSDETFRMNQEVFSFLTEEADKRGIWVIQMFYNVLVSEPFARHYGIETQQRGRALLPEIADYTRKSIAAFVENYPNVGLLVCLGEAMDNTVEGDVKWFTKTIIPGVQDGLKALGRTDEPPILLRAHDTDCSAVMDVATHLYSNLYTMNKYNGESLTTYEPGGPWGETHKALSALGSIHIENVHVLANLEPFRWGSPWFVQKTVQAMHQVHGANGLHLFPQANYWDWPWSADKLPDGSRLKEIERDWIWYQTWSRYAWKVDRDRAEEIDFWSAKLAQMYGTDLHHGRQIMTAYDEFAEIAPKLLRKFGITEGNRQTLLLGMFMSQLVNPAKWRVYPGFHDSCGPVGERLQEYVRKAWNNQPHVGEIPPQLIAEAVKHGRRAVEEIEKAAPYVTENRDEFERLRNDVHAYYQFAQYFAEKVKAAILVLAYSYCRELENLERAAEHMENSLVYFRELVRLADDKYYHANSMLTAQRRIPITGENATNKLWGELLPHYQEELSTFHRNIDFLRRTDGLGEIEITPLSPASPESFTLENSWDRVVLDSGAVLFADRPEQPVEDLDPSLTGLTAFVTDTRQQCSEGTQIRITVHRPMQLAVGYFGSERPEYLKAPVLETNALGNEYGEADPRIANAMKITGMPPMGVHTYIFREPGNYTLDLGKGIVALLGTIEGSDPVIQRDGGIAAEADNENVDWLFY
ncbi:MAG: hypothetical protein LUD68_01195 [Rikenellaceae bacterium]|nr:hypothetical protein [Rikenellaceae bacterium]